MFQSTLVQSNLDNKVGIVHCHQIICWLEINGCKIILISAKDKFHGFLMHENKSMNFSNLITTMTIYYFREILTELVHNKRWETKLDSLNIIIAYAYHIPDRQCVSESFEACLQLKSHYNLNCISCWLDCQIVVLRGQQSAHSRLAAFHCIHWDSWDTLLTAIISHSNLLS